MLTLTSMGKYKEIRETNTRHDDKTHQMRGRWMNSNQDPLNNDESVIWEETDSAIQVFLGSLKHSTSNSLTWITADNLLTLAVDLLKWSELSLLITSCVKVELACVEVKAISHDVPRLKWHSVPLVRASLSGLAGVDLELTVNQRWYQLNSVQLRLLLCGTGRFVRRWPLWLIHTHCHGEQPETS